MSQKNRSQLMNTGHLLALFFNLSRQHVGSDTLTALLKQSEVCDKGGENMTHC